MESTAHGRPDAAQQQRTVQKQPEPDFFDPSFEWRRVFAETRGTFLLVLVAAGGGVVAAGRIAALGTLGIDDATRPDTRGANVTSTACNDCQRLPEGHTEETTLSIGKATPERNQATAQYAFCRHSEPFPNKTAMKFIPNPDSSTSC